MRFNIIILLVGIFISNHAMACSCIMPSFEEKIANSSVIISGVVTEVKGTAGGRCGSKQATMKVTKQWKGKPLSEVTLVSSDACVGCGMYVQSGTTYIIYGGGDGKTIGVHGCSGDRPIRDDDKELQDLNEYFSQVEKFDKAIAAGNENIKATLNKSDFLFDKKDYLQVIKLLENISLQSKGKDHAQVWVRLGKAYEALKKYKNAVDAYKRALEASPSDALLKQRLQRAQLLSGIAIDIVFKDKNAENFDFSGIELDNYIFNNINLRNANFSRSKISNTMFVNVKLDNAKFDEIEFSNTRFEKSSLKNTQWHKAHLQQIHFIKNNMDGVLFNDITMDDTSFQNMKIKNIKFSQGYSHRVTFENVFIYNGLFENISFEALKAHDLHFDHAQISYVNANDASISNSDFISSKIKDLYLSHGNLAGISFKHSTLNESHFYQSILDKAKFIDVDLTEASFYAASLKGTIFEKIIADPLISSVGAREDNNRAGRTADGKTNFFMSVYDCSTQWPRTMNPSDAGAVLVDDKCRDRIKPIDFHEATIGKFNFIVQTGETEGDYKGRSQNFHHAIMPNANLQKIQFYGVSLEGADLSHADLTGAIIHNGSIKSVDLSHADLTGASFLLSEYDCATKWPEGYDYGAAGAISADPKCTKPADIRKANFNGVNYVNHDFQKANMEGLRFDRNDFQHSNFSDTDMSWIKTFAVNFQHAIFTNTNFSHANLSGSNFQFSNLKNALLDGAILNETDLSNVDMQHVELKKQLMKGATIQFSHFEHSNLTNAELERSKLQSSNFSHANLSDANLRYTQMQTIKIERYSDQDNSHHVVQNKQWTGKDGAIFDGANLSNADLSFSYIGDVDFSKANLTGTKLVLAQIGCNSKWPKDFSPTKAGAILEESCQNIDFGVTDLSNQKLSKIHLRGAHISKVDLTNTDLSFSDLTNTDLREAIFKDTSLLLAQYSCETTLFPDGFDPSEYGAIAIEEVCKDKGYGTPNFSGQDFQGKNLSNLYLSGMELSQANLKNTSLERADLSRANLQKSKLHGASLYSATLFEARLQGAEYDCMTQWPPKFDPIKAGAVKVGECKIDKVSHIQHTINNLLHDIPHQQDAKAVNLKDVDFYGRFFRDVNFSGADFSNANLDWVKFFTVNLSNVNFSGTSLRGATLSSGANVNYTGADLSHAEFHAKFGEDTIFRNAILKNTRFPDYSNIETVDLTGVKYDCRTFWGSNNRDFDPRTKGAILDDKPCH